MAGLNSSEQIVESIPTEEERDLKKTSSVRDKFSAPNFGSRFLTEDQDVFSQNAWDHVPPPTDQEEKVATALARQRNAPVPESEKVKYNDNPARHWDIFYKHNENNFFRDRKWLHLEFPELVAATQPEAGPMTILEVGCGAGNAVFPLLNSNENRDLSILACDYSPRAVQLVKSHPLYDSPPAGKITASVWDLSSAHIPENVAPASVDIVVMIFVLSALHPDEWRQAIVNLHTVLKPGGRVVLRDYGRFDLAQLRFKEGRLLSDNFYIRGDKTRVYFFTSDDLATIFTGFPVSTVGHTTMTTVVESETETPGETTPTGPDPAPSGTVSPLDLQIIGESQPGEAGTVPDISTLSLHAVADGSTNGSSISPLPPRDEPVQYPQHPLFSIDQLGVDNRLIVNRKRQLKMHRVWMQGKFSKIG